MSFYGFGIGLMTAITKILFRIRILGIENLKRDGGFILACNHISAYDPIFLSISAYKQKKKINYMAKEELMKIPIAGFVFKKLGAFPVRRGKGDRAALEKAISLVMEGKVFGIFPEGHRSKTGEPLQPKSGVSVVAARTHSDVIPAAIFIEGGRLKLGARVTLRFGEPVAYESLKLTGEYTTPMLKAASRSIMDHIIDLLNMGSAYANK